jgi:NitT/TauT family transport system permease protein
MSVIRLKDLEKPFLKSLGFLAPALIWEVLYRSGFLDSQFYPSLFQALGGIAELAEAKLLQGSIAISLWRAITGLLIASILAIPLGLLFGRWFPSSVPELGSGFNPLFRFLSLVNPFTLAPLFILFFGIGEGAKAGIVAWVCFWPIFFNTLEGAKGVDPILIKTARGMAASGPSLFFKIILPGASSAIFSGLKLGLEMSFFVLIAIEMIGASAGLGWLVQACYWNMRFSWMYGAIIVTIVIGFCMNVYLDHIHRKIFFWREDTRQPVSEKAQARKPFSGKDLAGAAALLLLILAAGFWQIKETQQEWQRFGKEGYKAAGIGIFDE